MDLWWTKQLPEGNIEKIVRPRSPRSNGVQGSLAGALICGSNTQAVVHGLQGAGGGHCQIGSLSGVAVGTETSAETSALVAYTWRRDLVR